MDLRSRPRRARPPRGLGHRLHGVFRTDPNSPEHGPGALLYGAVVVTYSDRGANGLPAATGEANRSPEPEGAAGRARHPPPGCRHLRRHRCLGRQRHPRSRSGRLPRLRPGELRRHRRSGRPCHRCGRGPAALGRRRRRALRHGEDPRRQRMEGRGDLVRRPRGHRRALRHLGRRARGRLAHDGRRRRGRRDASHGAHTLAPATPTGVGGVFNEPVRFSVQAVDNGTLASVQYSRDNARPGRTSPRTSSTA